MSTISEHHKAKCGVDGKCSVPMWQGGLPGGFCDRPAYGEQYAEGNKHAPHWWSRRDRNGYLIDPHNRKPYASSLCCDHHGGPSAEQIRFIQDGDMWCAFMPGFINLQESDAGFGATQTEAELALRALAQRSAGK